MSLALSSSYFLVFHGSRDRRGQLILSQLVHSLSTRLANKLILAQGKYTQQQPSLEVQNNIRNYTGNLLTSTTKRATIVRKREIPSLGIGSLELTTIPLQQKIEKYARSVREFGYKHLKILPLFLTPGVHVCEDIPAEIACVQRLLVPEMTIELLPYLGNYAQTTAILKKQFAYLPNEGKILLAHGTRYPKGNIWLENLATKLDARIAYYSVPGSLLSQIETLVSKQIPKIAIVPYFLFPGRITDAIAAEVDRLQQAFPQVQLLLGKPLGATGELANLIIEVLTR